MHPCFKGGDFLLPEHTDWNKWAVIACDQYTSQPKYWQQVKKETADHPSAYHLIYPEVYLPAEEEKIKEIHHTMEEYLQEHILKTAVHDGFVLIERATISGNRYGLLGVIDLDEYDYRPDTDKPIRATEGTIRSRIPPRVQIRQGGAMELSHVMVLIDDAKQELIEPLFEQRENFKKLYDFDLMQNGGHITGYAIEGKDAVKTENHILDMQKAARGLFLAVGDGNHSLATAKTCWETLKKELSEDERDNHPARYAMVELINLHSPALIFEPIHRVLFSVDMDDLLEAFQTFCRSQNIEWTEGDEICFYQNGKRKDIRLVKEDDRLPLDVLQNFLDDYIAEHPGSKMDYIHGEDAVSELTKDPANCGICLGRMDKNQLFPAIVAGGSLPRKTFSMGEADEKRFYLEARKVR